MCRDPLFAGFLLDYMHREAVPTLQDVPGIDHVEPDLTLRGIRYAWERIRAATPATTAREGGAA